MAKEIDPDILNWDMSHIDFTIKQVKRIDEGKHRILLQNHLWRKESGGLVFIVEARTETRSTDVWMTEGEAAKYATKSYEEILKKAREFVGLYSLD